MIMFSVFFSAVIIAFLAGLAVMFLLQKQMNRSFVSSPDKSYKNSSTYRFVHSEENYRSIINNIQDVVYRSNAEGKLIMISPSVTKVLGYESLEECIGMDIANEMYYSPAERDRLISLLQKNGKVTDYETILRTKDGSPVVVSTSSHLYYDKDGNFAGVEGVVRDITERKYAEDMFNKAFNENPCPMSISDISTGFYIEVNQAWLDALEYNRNEVVGRRAAELNIYRNISERDRIITSINTYGKAHNFEIEFISKNGNVRNGIFFGEIINVAGKKMLLSSVLNVTGQKDAERLLKKINEELSAANDDLMTANEEYETLNEELIATNTALEETQVKLQEREKDNRFLIDNLSVGLLVYNPQFQVIISNPRAAVILGITNEDMDSKVSPAAGWYLIDENENPIPYEQLPFVKVFSTGTPVQNFVAGVRHGISELFWLLCDAYPVTDSNGRIIQTIVTFIDITRRKLAEQEVYKLKNYLNNIIDSNPDMLVGLDSEMKITLINKKTEKFAGVMMMEALGVPVDTIIPDFATSIRIMKTEIIDNKPVTHRGVLLEKNSEKRFYNLTLYPLISSGMDGAVVLIIDVTDIIKKEEQLRQAQKMETVGTLAGGLAHDFNNVLSGIVGTTSLIIHIVEKDNNMSERFRNYIDVIDKSGKRAAEMVQQLLTLSRKSEIRLIPLDINRSLQNIIQICRNTFDKSIEILTEYSTLPAMILGDPSQIEQVFLNLCINSSHAMTIMRKENDNHGGKLTLSVRNIIADKYFCSSHSEASPGRYWAVSQSDTGVGIDSENIHKIFDPFFTTKERDNGTGLGLSMVYSIVHNHGGFIDVYSELGTGTTFNIYFPALTGERTLEITSQDPGVEKGEGLILVIDDEEIVRLIAENILLECGYDVISAGSGKEGISIYNSNVNKIKCVVLDMAMPSMSGKEVYIELKKINPEVKVLLASGFKQDERVQETLSLGVNSFIQKPYSMTELSHKVKQLI